MSFISKAVGVIGITTGGVVAYEAYNTAKQKIHHAHTTETSEASLNAVLATQKLGSGSFISSKLQDKYSDFMRNSKIVEGWFSVKSFFKGISDTAFSILPQIALIGGTVLGMSIAGKSQSGAGKLLGGVVTLGCAGLLLMAGIQTIKSDFFSAE